MAKLKNLLINDYVGNLQQILYKRYVVNVVRDSESSEDCVRDSESSEDNFRSMVSNVASSGVKCRHVV